MIRLIFVALLVAALTLAVFQCWRLLRSKRVDWSGVAFAIGFVVLAFYLRHVTGIGQ